MAYRIYSGSRAGYYHPDHTEPVSSAEAITFEDIGDRGAQRRQGADDRAEDSLRTETASE